jgi:hypothetical protein
MDIRQIKRLSELENTDTVYYARFTAVIFTVRDRETQYAITVSDLTENKLFDCPYNSRVFFGSFDKPVEPKKLFQIVVFPDHWTQLMDQYESSRGSFVSMNSQLTNVTKYAIFVEITAKVKRYRDWLEGVVTAFDPQTTIKLIHPDFNNVDLRGREVAFKNILEGFPLEFIESYSHPFLCTFGPDVLLSVITRLRRDGRIRGPLDPSLQANDPMKKSPPPELPTDDEYDSDYNKRRRVKESRESFDETRRGSEDNEERQIVESTRQSEPRRRTSEEVNHRAHRVDESRRRKSEEPRHKIERVEDVLTDALFRELNKSEDNQINSVTGFVVNITNLDMICTKSHKTSIPKLNQIEFLIVESMNQKTYDELDVIRVTFSEQDLCHLFAMDEIEEIYIKSDSIKDQMTRLLFKQITLHIERSKNRISDGNYLLGWRPKNVKLDVLLESI